MITVHIYKKKFQMPEQWNQLTGKQLIQLAFYLVQDNVSYKEKVYILKVCLGLSDKELFNYAWLPKWLSNTQFFKKIEVLLFLHDHLHLIDFLFEHNHLTKQLLPRLVHWSASKNYWGPADNFENLTMDEFCFSEYHFLEFKKTNSRDALIRFVATLYRPAKKGYSLLVNKDGDIRVPFNEHLIKSYAKDIARFSLSHMLGVFIWYMGCRYELIRLFPKVFNGKESDTESFGLFSLITSVAEDGVMGDFDKVNKKQVHTILLRLTELINQAEKAEADIKAIA